MEINSLVQGGLIFALASWVLYNSTSFLRWVGKVVLKLSSFYVFCEEVDGDYESISIFLQDKCKDNQCGDYKVSYFDAIPLGYRWFIVNKRLVIFSSSMKKLETTGSHKTQINTIGVRIFGHKRRKLFEEIINSGNSLYKEKMLTKQSYVYSNNESSWMCLGKIKERNKNTIFLDNIDEIFEDIDNFLQSKDTYRQRGLPYKRGYLFYGPTGTGKTSLVSSIAYHFKRDLRIVNLLNLTESGLTSLMCQSDTIFLFEDFDLQLQKLAENIEATLSLGNILNAFDGVCSGDGSVIIVTTNNKGYFPPQLFRPGRIDKKYEIGYINSNTANKFIKHYFPQTQIESKYLSIFDNNNISPATLQNLLASSGNIQDVKRGLSVMEAHEITDFAE